MSKNIVITGASSGFGAMTARALADAGHTVYAGMCSTTDRHAPAVADLAGYAKSHSVDLRSLEMDISDQASVDTAVERIITEAGHLDVVIHNAGHMVLGPDRSLHPGTTRPGLRHQRGVHAARAALPAPAHATRRTARVGGLKH